MARFNDVYDQMQVQEDMIQKSSMPVRAKKSAMPMMSKMKMARKADSGSDDEMSGAEDDGATFGASFGKKAKAKKKVKVEKKSGGGLFGSFFGGSKAKKEEKEGRSMPVMSEAMAMPKQAMMMEAP